MKGEDGEMALLVIAFLASCAALIYLSEEETMEDAAWRKLQREIRKGAAEEWRKQACGLAKSHRG